MTAQPDDGNTVFPYAQSSDPTPHPDMVLRDWFAGLAMRRDVIVDRKCQRCHGEGKIWASLYGSLNSDVWPETCPVCEGSGVEEYDLNDEIEDWMEGDE